MSMNLKTLADSFSLKAFMNSFLRDYHGDSRITCDDSNVQIKLNERQMVSVELSRRSLLGSHKYTGKIEVSQNNKIETLSFSDFSSLILKEFFQTHKLNEFQDCLNNSVENMRSLVEHKFHKTEAPHVSYASSEQNLILGHPFHPYPKCKLGMNARDMIQYAPEFETSFALVWLELDRQYFSSNASLETYQKSIQSLLEFELGLSSTNKNSFFIPVHPWQWEHLQSHPEISSLKVVQTLKGKNIWKPLSSMRSLYNEQAAFQLKFSLSVKITNSIRHLQPKEAIRGHQIQKALLESAYDPNASSMKVLWEPFFASLKTANSEALAELSVQFRHNIPQSPPQEEDVLLSYLTEESIHTQKTRLSQLIETISTNDFQSRLMTQNKWLENYYRHAVLPLLKLAFDNHVLLGAHLQNIVLKLQDGMPIGSYYRDCQGTGFTKKGEIIYSKNDSSIGKKNGNVLDRNDVEKVFGYYLIVNQVFGVISALADSDLEVERRLLSKFRVFLCLSRDENNKDFIDFIVHSPTLLQKGNFRCSVEQLNETTTERPWDLYNNIPNPFINELRPIASSIREGEVYRAQVSKETFISFSAFDLAQDLDVFHTWHQKPFVADFWEMKHSKEELKNYILRLKASPYQLPLIFKINDKPVGYFEIYWAYEDRIAPYCGAQQYDRGLHLLIGEEHYLGTKAAYNSILHVSKFMFQDCQKTQTLWGEPRADNSKIKRLADKLPGWRFVREFDFPHKRAALLECNRSKFYEELPNAL